MRTPNDDDDGLTVDGPPWGCAVVILAGAVFILAMNATEIISAINGCLQ